MNPSDRSVLTKLASALPAGSPERRALLASLTASSEKEAGPMKMIMVVDDRSGEILADVEERKLEAWLKKNRMVVAERFLDEEPMVSVRPA